ncbi:MAG: hypothetical protein ABIY70_25370 [Capsulimonas sp.]|uniref:hypothetical protein n=1 Tax=Capsulimonas sp. TaxID=2494211 RepID=UPI003262DC1C
MRQSLRTICGRGYSGSDLLRVTSFAQRVGRRPPEIVYACADAHSSASHTLMIGAW